MQQKSFPTKEEVEEEELEEEPEATEARTATIK